MKTRQHSLFDEAEQLNKLSKIGDPLERLSKVIDWEMFRPILKKNVVRKETTKKGGRPPYDVVLMFKIMILQRLYNISDDQTEYQINDRLSFQRFLGLTIGDPVPDAKTIWKFKNDLAESNAIEKLFKKFDDKLEAEGLITHKGTIIDATFVDVPRQRNSGDENKSIKNGDIPDEWKAPDKTHMLAQKDTDARWAKKNEETHYGYKDHVKCDADSKLIMDYGVTPASTHDSEMCLELLETDDNNAFYADSAYSGSPIAEGLPEGCVNKICEKATRNHPLTKRQQRNNRRKSKTRCRIEHIFGFMTNSLGGISIRSIGFKRAWSNIGIMNLTYNLCRYEILKRPSST